MPPEKFQVGLVQMSATSDPESNLRHALDLVRQAAARGAGIVCLPELFQTQYFCQREEAALFDLAEPIPGPTTARLSDLARELHIVLIASLFERRAAGVFRMIRCTTRSTTSRRATWAFALLTPRWAVWAHSYAGISGIRKAPA